VVQPTTQAEHPPPDATPDVTPPTASRWAQVRAVGGVVLTVVAFLIVWLGLVVPNQLSQFTLAAFIRIPVEGLVLVAVGLLLPARARQIVAAAAGVLLGVLIVLKILDMGFFAALDRPFSPVTDWGYLGPAVGVLRDSVGSGWAVAAVVVAAVRVLAVLVFIVLAVLRVSRLTATHRATSARAVVALGVVWALCAVLGAQLGHGPPIASSSAAGLAYQRIHDVSAAIKDERQFSSALAAHDQFRTTPADNLLTGLRGKDVIVAFVESYGRVAVQGSAFSPQVDAVLDSGTNTLRAAGFSTRSAFLTSPTFGGISWLAHSTLQSGLWVDNQRRYDKLVGSDRFTLSDAFKRAGWRTVADVPSNDEDWPQGTSFYHYDKIYDDRNVGYVGPKFSYAAMPDQYILSYFQRAELAKPNHQPVMAEIDLVSSHTPWAPLPRRVDWAKVGDGSIFDPMPAQGQSANSVWQSSTQIKAAYGQSIEYSLTSLISFVQTFHDNNLVLVLLGDHQPATVVTGSGASHDVPITIVAHDPAVMNQISAWGWQDGMRPGPQAPVWPMDAFRDRFLTAYGPQPATSPPAPVQRAAGR
jgi:hypothetical protein